MKRNRNFKFMWLLGFLGFLGFRYFTDHNIGDLGYFAFFGYFGYFWVYRIADEMIDERYIENSRNAKAFTFSVAIIEFVILYFICLLNFSRGIIIVVTALCFASLLISYAIAFYKFEKM